MPRTEVIDKKDSTNYCHYLALKKTNTDVLFIKSGLENGNNSGVKINDLYILFTAKRNYLILYKIFFNLVRHFYVLN